MVLAAAPGSASAATVAWDGGTIKFLAAPGETNRLTAGFDSRGDLRFTDTANPVYARRGCVQEDLHTARCELRGEFVPVRLGDGDDRADVAAGGFILSVRGGRGDDVLVGSRGDESFRGDRGADRLVGASGDDQLTGGPGRDHVSGGPGDDLLSDGERDRQAASDVFIGGDHDRTANTDFGDTLSYFERRADLRIDLSTGGANVEDRIIAIESVGAGRGDDHLTGSDGENVLSGGSGEDTLHGLGGNDIVSGDAGDDESYGDDGTDTVWGNNGSDVISGGAGTDFVISAEESRTAQADTVTCEAGADVARSDAQDTLTADCEQLSAFSNGLTMSTEPQLDAGSAQFSLRCSEPTGPGGCGGTVTMRGADGQLLGAAPFLVPSDSTATAVTVTLSAAAGAALLTGTAVQVEVTSARPSLAATGGYRMFMRAPAPAIAMRDMH